MSSGKLYARQAPKRCWLVTSMLGSVFGAGLSLAAPASASILITIDKSSQQMSVAVDGAQRYVWPVSTGRPGYDTPGGNYKPNRMDADITPRNGTMRRCRMRFSSISTVTPSTAFST